MREANLKRIAVFKMIALMRWDRLLSSGEWESAGSDSSAANRRKKARSAYLDSSEISNGLV